MENTEPVKPANDTQNSESVDDEKSNELFDTVDNGEEGDPVGPERPGGRFRRWRQRRREKQRARARMRAELQPLDEVEPEKKQLVREEYLLVVSRRMVWITLSVPCGHSQRVFLRDSYLTSLLRKWDLSDNPGQGGDK